VSSCLESKLCTYHNLLGKTKKKFEKAVKLKIDFFFSQFDNVEKKWGVALINKNINRYLTQPYPKNQRFN